jgi:hypothetical protein
MNINSFYLGLAEKALPPVNVYSINYKWDFTPHGFPCDLIYPCRGHNNNQIILIQANFLIFYGTKN